ncbi:hypothetical protein [Streptomyces nodosus]|uniref:hypothetical protein n=1 Tax=Streptomyces nodosus TaxID=40318 RepID=UPI0038126C58
MWPGEQPSGDGHSPQQPPAPSQSNPYRQPGYHQPNPYQPSGPWHPAAPSPGAPTPPPAGGGRDRTKLVAIVAAAAVVVAAGVTGFLLLGGGTKDDAGPEPVRSGSPRTDQDNPRDADPDRPTVEGWKVVVSPDTGIAFDVPPEWAPMGTGWVTYVSEDDDPDDKPLIGMRATAYLKQKWCAVDENKDGTPEYTALAAAGSKGNNGAKDTEEIAVLDPKAWVYGMYTQPDRTKVKPGSVESFTTRSGITGSLGSAWSVGVEKTDKCATDGKAWTFAFKDAEGDLVSWSFVGAKGVSDEVPDATVRRIAATVRLHKDASGS